MQTDAPELPYDGVTELAHRLIRGQASDDFDPFMLHGHPCFPEGDARLVRACFYYAVVVTPKVTMLYDNDGRGGMCDMVVEEVRAIWRTPELLDAFGIGFDDLKNGQPILPEVDLPKPRYSWDEGLETD